MDEPDYAYALAKVGVLGHLSWRVAVSEGRRTIGFTVSADGALTIAVPRGADPAEVVAAVRTRLPWMVRTMVRQAEISVDCQGKEIVNGENFPYLGRPRRLLLVDAAKEDVELVGDRLRAVRGQPAQVAKSIVAWYVRSGTAWLGERAPYWARRLGVRPAAASVDDLSQRWGQRTKNGAIVLHWAVFQLSPHLIEFVVVHELAHLAEPGHGFAFQRLVGQVLPDHSVRSDELAHAGRNVWLGQILSVSRV